MSLFTRAALIGICAVAAAAGIRAAQAGGLPDQPIAVHGTEQLAWDQSVSRAGWIVGYQFVAYVDDVPAPVPDAKCSPIFCTQCACVAAIPRMSNGTHRIEMVARDMFGVESARSSPIFVALGTASIQANGLAAAASASAQPAGSLSLTGVEVLSTSLDRPSGIAVAPDGRIFVAQGPGDIVVWSGGRIESTPAARLHDIVDGPAGLADLTLDPDFSNNRRVFVAYSARNPDGSFANRIVRYREVGAVFGEAAVILEDRVRDRPERTPRVRFGPDGKLFALFPAGEPSPDAARTYTGTLLRLNVDGTTPRDNPGMTPAVSGMPPFLTTFDWEPRTRTLWTSGQSSAVAFFRGRRLTESSGELAPYGRITTLVVGADGALYFGAVNPGELGKDVLARVKTMPLPR